MRSKRGSSRATLKPWLGVSLALALSSGLVWGEMAPSAWADSSPSQTASASPSSPTASPASSGTTGSSQTPPPASSPVVADATPPAATATPAPPATPTPLPDMLIPSANIHFKGFIDGYAQYNPTDASYSNFRAYDFGANSFNINMAQLKIWRPDDDGIGFVLRTDFGPGAMASGQNFTPGFFGTQGTSGGNTGTMPWSMFWLEEAYVNLWIPDTNKELEMDAGQFQTLANFEVIQPTGNWMASLGYTFFLGAYTHTGVRFHYAPNGSNNIYFGVNNGWNTSFQNDQGSDFQDFELNYTGNPVSWLNLNFTGLFGPQFRNTYPGFGAYNAATTSPYGTGTDAVANVPTWRNYGAFVVEVGPLRHFWLVTDDSYGWQAQGAENNGATRPNAPATWYSSENFLRYDISDSVDVVARYEVYYDLNGFMTGTGVPTAINDESIDLQWNFMPNAFTRFEYRHDNSDVAIFNSNLGNVTGSGDVGNHGSPIFSMDTFEVELTYMF
ncbi:MAG: outer membrane beta-barrel protein [Leptospirillum sp.]